MFVMCGVSIQLLNLSLQGDKKRYENGRCMESVGGESG